VITRMGNYPCIVQSSSGSSDSSNHSLTILSPKVAAGFFFLPYAAYEVAALRQDPAYASLLDS